MNGTTTYTPGQELRRLRKRRKYSVRDVADRTGLHLATCYKHENDQQVISADAALRYAELYRVSVQRFYQPRRLANG